MNSYGLVVKLKLGLIVAAMVIAVASLVYTNNFADQVREREEDSIQLYANAVQYTYEESQRQLDAPLEQFRAMERLLLDPDIIPIIEQHQMDRDVLLDALAWVRNVHKVGAVDFITREITIPLENPNRFGVPAIIIASDSISGDIHSFRSIGIDSVKTRQDTMYVRELASEMKAQGQAVPITIRGRNQGQEYTLSQVLYYGESDLIRQLRVFPFIQLFFVALFILVGYVGFSYVRKNEQSNLWVGMAKEAAHQLGTPISSMMGWTEILRMEDLPMAQRVADELDKDIDRLNRVVNRFSKIGSKPSLDVEPLEPVITSVLDYIRQRIPEQGNTVVLKEEVEPDLKAPLNVELFEWVIENLLKNALDALEGEAGTIALKAGINHNRICIDISDTGKGIEKQNWKNVFRPGFSTKKRGWGLGLSLAKRIVEDYHGGTLQVLNSKVGEGTTFRITLTTASDEQSVRI